MGYDIVSLETQNNGQDWPLIVTAIPCPTCGAEVGEMCHSVGAASNVMLLTGSQRIDWHAARKQNAAAAWYTREQSASQPMVESAQPTTETMGTGESKETATGSPVAQSPKPPAPPPPPPPPD